MIITEILALRCVKARTLIKHVKFRIDQTSAVSQTEGCILQRSHL